MTTFQEAIESNRRVAIQQRAVGQMKLQWELDTLGLLCGTVEVVPRESDEDVMRRDLRRKPAVERPARMIPMGADQNGQNWCILVQDKENI